MTFDSHNLLLMAVGQMKLVYYLRFHCAINRAGSKKCSFVSFEELVLQYFPERIGPKTNKECSSPCPHLHENHFHIKGFIIFFSFTFHVCIILCIILNKTIVSYCRIFSSKNVQMFLFHRWVRLKKKKKGTPMPHPN